MATIARLVIALGADPSGLRSDLQRSQRIVNDFTRAANRNVSLFGNLDSEAKRVANTFVRNLQSTFRNNISQARADLAQGLINPAQFSRIARESATTYNTALRRGIGRLEGLRVITPEMRATMLGQFIRLGEDSARAFTTRLARVGDSLSTLGRQWTFRVTLPITAAGVVMLKTAAKFEQGLNRVRAITNATGAEMERLSDAARRTAGAFTATEITDAQTELARAGLKVNQIIGATPGVLQLAVAGQQNLADSTRTAVRVLTEFGLASGDIATNLGHVNDVLAKGANQTVTNVADLGQALTYAGGIAHSTGQSLEETVASLALFAQAGINASRGGTALVGILNRLSNPQAFKGMKDLALLTRDASGQLLPLVDIIEQIEKRGIKSGAILNAFGQRAGPAMVALVNQGSKALREMTASLENSGGTAERVANAQLQGLSGQMRALRAAATELSIAFGESGVLNSVTTFVKGLTGVIARISQLNPAILRTIAVFAAVAAAVGPLAFILGKLLSTLALLRLAFPAVAAATLTFGAALSSLSIFLIGAGAIIAPLTILGSLLLTNAQAAADMAREIDRVRDSVSGLTRQQIRAELDIAQRELGQAQEALRKAREEAKQVPPPSGFLTQSTNPFATRATVVKTESSAVQQLSADVDRAHDRVTGLTEALRQNRAQATQTAPAVQQVSEAYEQLLGELEGAMTGLTDDPLKALKAKVQDTVTLLNAAVAQGRDLTTPLRLAGDLLAEVNRRIEAGGGALRTQNADLVALGETLRSLISDAPQQGLQQAIARARLALEAAFAIPEGTVTRAGSIEAAIAEMERLQKSVTAEIERQGGRQKASLDILREQLQITKDINDARTQSTQVGAPLPTIDLRDSLAPDIAQLSEAARAFAAARTRFQEAQRAENEGVAREARKSMELLRVALLSARSAFAANLLTQPVQDAKQLANAVKAADDAMAEFGVTTEDLVVSTTTVLDIIGSLATALNGVLQGASAFGEIGDKARGAIDGVLGLVQAIQQIKGAQGGLGSLQGVTGLLGVIGSALGILGSLFGGGPSPGERLLEENNKALDRLRQSLDDSIGATSKQLSAQRALANRSALFKDVDFTLGGGFSIGDLNRNLRQFGLTFDELQAIAEKNGLSLLDEKGRLVVGALDQLEEALGITIGRLTEFGKSLDDQQAQLDARNRIFGTEGSRQNLQDTRNLFQSLAPELFAQLFSGLDLSGGAGRDVLRQRMQDLFEQIENGLLPPSALGSLTGLEDLITLLLGLDDALDEITDSMTAFANTVDEQRARLSLRDALAGTADTPTAAINRELELLQQFAPAIASMFGDIELTGQEGRAQFREALQNLFHLIETGLVNEALLGSLGGIDELVAIITALATGLNELDTTVQEVNRQLANVPSGFKVALARFEATSPRSVFDNGEGPIPILPPPQSVTFVVENVEINGVEKSPEEHADEFLRVLNARTRARYGRENTLFNL